MTDLATRLRRLEDTEAIRALDAEYCRLLDDGDWPGLATNGLTAFWHNVTNLEITQTVDIATVRSFLWQPCVPHVAAGRYHDELVRVGGTGASGWSSTTSRPPRRAGTAAGSPSPPPATPGR